ncbi:crotonase/enoyl-CoA hydratase family protein [Ferribacterium limneticum]|uniref:crotonase/enoyl-CoA hydratase family protein n=1 Tax=Ferribacterium limneticum TaxID=76259 RepID=UPI001CFA9B3A|nr:crotonase/enoyl-CoA hydratase family protein [Ferribacterium limneticum]UCV29328.1 crotonase/enoyl-CoA hydratase family protein [Ferribacterium limneticum]UCV33247.1 crotonase/enoyl-CoA hydratase family protein [Ferribacterium limneticum]
MQAPGFSTLTVTLSDHIAEVCLDRPDKSNAMNAAMWQEIRQAFEWVDSTPEARVAILSGAGKNFCAGIDLAMLGSIQQQIANPDGARSREALRRLILDLQDCLSSIERCRKPVLAAIQGACVGGALDLVTCCDMRYAAADAIFSIKEIDLGMVADVGTLQRLPRLIGDGMARELAYTGRNVDATEAEKLGLVNRTFASATLAEEVRQLAKTIATKSPLATRGLKEVMNYSRDHSVSDGLNYVATWNAAMLLSADLNESITAQQERRPARFAD